MNKDAVDRHAEESKMDYMAAKKPPKKRDGHKPSRMTRIPERMAEKLEILARRKETALVDEVKQAVREYLERHDLWPTDPD